MTTRIDRQDFVCQFVREVVAARTGEAVALTGRPDVDHRDIEAVEELWESRTRRYAVEHTLIESFEGQQANTAKIRRLLVPVKDALAGRVPGRFVLAVREQETAASRVRFEIAHQEVTRLVLEAADLLAVGETRILRSALLPFEMQLHRRHSHDSSIILQTDIAGDPEALRVERVARAFDEKCPKLMTWARDGRTSVLILESDDIQLSNVWVTMAAVKASLASRGDQPDVIVLVETDSAPAIAWVLKEGDRLGDDVPRRNGVGYYTHGQVASLPQVRPAR